MAELKIPNVCVVPKKKLVKSEINRNDDITMHIYAWEDPDGRLGGRGQLMRPAT